MAVNPTTGIDVSTDRFVIWRVSTQQYTNMNAVWPRTDGGQLQGANPDFEYYKKVDTPSPDVDHRFTLTTTFGRVETTPKPAAGLPMGTYEADYDLVKLPLADLLAQIETEYQRQVRMQFPETENPSTIINVGGILIKQQAGAVLTEAEQATIAAFVGVRENISQLAARKAELDAAATADEDYDLTVWPQFS
jgi:hypothetical protein